MSTTSPICRKFLAGPFQSRRALTVRILTTTPAPVTAVGRAMIEAANRG